MRWLNRRSCSSSLRDSQYLTRMIPERTRARSSCGQVRKNSAYSSSATEPHDLLHPGPVVPAPVEEDDLTGGREVGDVTLEVPLRPFPVGRGAEGHHPAVAGVEPVHDPLDGATLARGVPAFEDDHHPEPGVDDPLLHADQLGLQPEQLLLVGAFGHHRRDREGRRLPGVVARAIAMTAFGLSGRVVAHLARERSGGHSITASRADILDGPSGVGRGPRTCPPPVSQESP